MRDMTPLRLRGVQKLLLWVPERGRGCALLPKRVADRVMSAHGHTFKRDTKQYNVHMDPQMPSCSPFSPPIQPAHDCAHLRALKKSDKGVNGHRQHFGASGQQSGIQQGVLSKSTRSRWFCDIHLGSSGSSKAKQP